MRRATCPPSAAGQVGIRLQRHHCSGHAIGHDPQPGPIHSSARRSPSKRLDGTAPDQHKLPFCKGCGSDPRHGILFARDGAFDAGIRRCLIEAAAAGGPGSRLLLMHHLQGPTPWLGGGRQVVVNEVWCNGFCPAKRSRRARCRQGRRRLSRQQSMAERLVRDQISGNSWGRRRLRGRSRGEAVDGWGSQFRAAPAAAVLGVDVGDEGSQAGGIGQHGR